MGSVGIDVDLDPRLDEVRTQRAFGDLQFERAVGHAIVVADLALLLDAQDLAEIDARDRGEGRAGLSRRCGEALIVGGQMTSRMKALAASIEVIPASLSSFTSRSCKVWNARSERPRACGE